MRTGPGQAGEAVNVHNMEVFYVSGFQVNGLHAANQVFDPAHELIALPRTVSGSSQPYGGDCTATRFHLPVACL